MQILTLAAAGLAVFSFAAAVPRPAFADAKARLSGPHVHENLAVYFLHGTSAPGPVPLTLQEALEKGSVRVLETGAVSELKIENTGEEDIFIQAGDIVKGGKQDRVLTLSFVLPPKSGEVPIAAFCVERGRWAARGLEDVHTFASAAEAMPSRKAKLVMAARPPLAAMPEEGPEDNIGQRRAPIVNTPQVDVWNSVAETQSRLSASLSAPVASADSETSLQLSLENKKLQEARAAYIDALKPHGEKADDIVGYVIAINGKPASADVYPSNALFRKMWEKQLAAGVTESIGARSAPAGEVPTLDAVSQFLEAAEKGEAHEQTVSDLSRQEVRDAQAALFVEARRGNGEWVHRNYLAK